MVLMAEEGLSHSDVLKELEKQIRQKRGQAVNNCLFCRISAKKIPAKIIYEDSDAVAFEDINPQAPVHVLIIPKKHISTSLEITAEDDALIGHLFQVGSKDRQRKRHS